MIFYFFFSFFILQRIVELFIAKKNERMMKKKGAIEFGRKQYAVIVLLHITFFISYLSEVMILHKGLSILWPLLIIALSLTQLLRLWVIVSLGERWNTKILVLPKKDVVVKGPYRLIRHPNYVVVVCEFLLIPLFFQAYVTAILFSLCNVYILFIRIREEEKALLEMTDYGQRFTNISRFTP